jgi:hypothetical protein
VATGSAGAIARARGPEKYDGADETTARGVRR